MLRIFASLFALLLLGAAGQAPAHSDPWQTFLQETYARFTNPGEATTLEDDLYRVGHGLGYEAAISRFAQEKGYSFEHARAYADLIVAAVNFRNACGNPGPCVFAPGQPLYDLTARAAMQEPTGSLMIVVGRNLGQEGPMAPVLARLAARHP